MSAEGRAKLRPQFVASKRQSVGLARRQRGRVTALALSKRAAIFEWIALQGVGARAVHRIKCESATMTSRRTMLIRPLQFASGYDRGSSAADTKQCASLHA